MENKKTRIYGKSIDIKKEKVQLFWNSRAEKYSEDNPYKSVKCNDSNNEYVNKLDEYEKEIIIPKLNINKDSKVLDIGCGVGRLAEIIIPKCKYYVGTDFAQNLLSISRERIGMVGNCDFQVCDFLNLIDNGVIKKNCPFNTVVLAGVAMYINDDELKNCFERLLKILDKDATIYLTGPIGIEKRLTLNEFYSKELNSEYNVIYRTVDEYIRILKVFIDNGFEIIENNSFLTEVKQYSDTERYYFILRRK